MHTFAMHLKTAPLVVEVTQSERFYGLAWGPPLLPFDPPNWGGGDMGVVGGAVAWSMGKCSGQCWEDWEEECPAGIQRQPA